MCPKHKKRIGVVGRAFSEKSPVALPRADCIYPERNTEAGIAVNWKSAAPQAVLVYAIESDGCSIRTQRLLKKSSRYQGHVVVAVQVCRAVWRQSVRVQFVHGPVRNQPA